MNPLLHVQQLKLVLPTPQGSLQALRDINFHLHAGESVGLIGESGCGKSLTAASILKLLPSTATLSGKICFEGANLLNKKEKEMVQIRGQQISLIFQDPSSALNPTKRIGDQLIEGLIWHKQLARKEAIKQGIAWLKKVGLSDAEQRMQQYPHEISGGMKQRILIAMVLACEPKLLIADEPTTALDVTIQAQILELLKELQKEKKLAILLISHDLGVIARCCDRLLVMYAGQIIESGPIEQLLSSPKHPYTQALIRAKKSLTESKSHALWALPGTPPTLYHAPSGCAFFPRCSSAKPICQQSMPNFIDSTNKQQAACWLYEKESNR